jgi:peroxiredoxin Q/BCP
MTDKAKDFCLDGVDAKGKEKEYCLKSLLGKKNLILFFYPKDNTSG